MNISMKDNIVTIELDDVKHTLTRAQARTLSNQIIATIEETEDYLSLKKGDPIYYVDPEEGIIEEGTIYSVHIKNNRVDVFSVDFKDDFDEFDGKGLGVHFFRDKSRAEDALKRA